MPKKSIHLVSAEDFYTVLNKEPGSTTKSIQYGYRDKVSNMLVLVAEGIQDIRIYHIPQPLVDLIERFALGKVRRWQEQVQVLLGGDFTLDSLDVTPYRFRSLLGYHKHQLQKTDNQESRTYHQEAIRTLEGAEYLLRNRK